MGQKVNPIGFRLAVSKDWRSKWFATGKDYVEFLHSDLAIRRYLKGKLSSAALAKIVIERAWNLVRVTLHTARPGLVIGRKGQEIEVMSGEISQMCGGKQVKIDILEDKGLGRRMVNYKLRDWLFSRQRYWGEPFPLLHDVVTGQVHAVDESHLPVLLPEVEDFRPRPVTEGSTDVVPPLGRATDWQHVWGVVQDDWSVRYSPEGTAGP